MIEPTRGREYCKQCQSSQKHLERSQGLETCSRCSDGFSISNGQCVNMRSFIKIGFHVGTAGRLFEHSDIAVALPQAFERAMQEILGVAAQVISLASIIDEATAAGKTLVTVVMTNGQNIRDWSNAESPLEGTAFLTQSQVRLKALNTNKFRHNIAAVLTKELQVALNGNLPAFPLWVESAFESEGFCPHLRRWRGPDQGCSESSEIPSPASPVEAVLPARADDARPRDDKIPPPHSSVEAVLPAAADITRAREHRSDHDRDHLAGDRNNRLQAKGSHGDRASGASRSVVTGASFGAALGAVLVVIVSVWRARCRSASEAAEKAQLFKGLAGTSSW